ncbi:hypothetical protein [Streptomyces sp. NPDC056255]|uniref:hypothetical protein n=1 Tax=Streptomyces sp. NPDC056255 TaxID=3345764 RepID=UPI0035D743E5
MPEGGVVAGVQVADLAVFLRDGDRHDHDGVAGGVGAAGGLPRWWGRARRAAISASVGVTRFRARLLELSTTVSTHPFWESVEAGDRVAARMALKHAHEPAEDEA